MASAVAGQVGIRRQGLWLCSTKAGAGRETAARVVSGRTAGAWLLFEAMAASPGDHGGGNRAACMLDRMASRYMRLVDRERI